MPPDIPPAHGDWPIKPPLPLIPGHDGAGIVDALGPGAGDEIGVGDRSRSRGSVSLADTAGTATRAWETLCEAHIKHPLRHGRRVRRVHRPYARHVVDVPDGVDPWTPRR